MQCRVWRMCPAGRYSVQLCVRQVVFLDNTSYFRTSYVVVITAAVSLVRVARQTPTEVSPVWDIFVHNHHQWILDQVQKNLKVDDGLSTWCAGYQSYPDSASRIWTFLEGKQLVSRIWTFLEGKLSRLGNTMEEDDSVSFLMEMVIGRLQTEFWFGDEV